jgi:F420-dependent oxidoreductase-like protein
LEGDGVPVYNIEFGVYLPQLHFSFADIRELTQAADRLGYDSIWFMDHFYTAGMPQVDTFEAWTTASALAPLTERIRLGHMVLCNAFRHPGLLAKMASSLDVISGGRLDLGLGTGSVPEEFGKFGIPLPSFRERTEQLDEALQILKLLFVENETTFTGKHYQLNGAPMRPKPIQKPYPPIMIGGGGEKFMLPLVARHADIWNCPTYFLGQLERKIAVLRDACAQIGRDFAGLRLSQQAILVIGKDDAEVAAALAVAARRYPGPSWGLMEGGFIGTPDKIVKKIREQHALGISQFVFFFYDRAAIGTLELFANEVMPAFRNG